MNKINFISETDTKSIHEILNKKIKADLFLRKQPGVYFLIKGNEVVYVGQSEDVPVRIRSHKHGGLIEFDHVYYLHVSPEKLVEVEKYYIRLLKPKRNRAGIKNPVEKQKNITKTIRQCHSTISKNTQKNIPTHATTIYKDLLTGKLMELNLINELIHGTYGAYITQNSSYLTYWYFQRTDPVSGERTKIYLGPDKGENGERIRRLKKMLEEYRNLGNLEQFSQRVGVLRKFCALPTNLEAKTLIVLEKAGFFSNGGVLIGTHAFRSFGLVLGYYLRDNTRTTDIYLFWPRTTNLSKQKLEEMAAIITKNLSLQPLPTINKKQRANAFNIEKSDLKLEILTDIVHAKSNPKAIKSMLSLPFYAQPLELQDYLTQNAIPVVIPVNKGILVNIPEPERFAVHKLWLSDQRKDTLKTRKDLAQAALIISILERDAPGKIERALSDFCGWPTVEKKHVDCLENGLKNIEKYDRYKTTITEIVKNSGFTKKLADKNI